MAADTIYLFQSLLNLFPFPVVILITIVISVALVTGLFKLVKLILDAIPFL